ncbi:MAG: class II fructose-1,6-bisphosphate aldolase [Clostridium sp.]|uniref:class II fructose-1,6-bisphosphate aldolase n=1 Tax=Clostridium sp. TaxID=1506 RepID=UPI003F3A9C18
MELVKSKELLKKAQEGNYAIGAFNVENMEMVMAVISAAEEMNAPVILQTTPSTVKYADVEYFLANARVAASKAKIPVVMHLDHGSSFELAAKAFRAGYTSIMIDGSHLEFEENIKLTKSVVRMCKASEVSVEAELGKVGGKEDDLDGGEGNPYTEPLEAKEFVEKTGVDSLAIAIGTAHGLYKGEPRLDLERLTEIRRIIDIPLVLHGGSGVPDESVKEAICRGICKVNYATEVRIAFTEGVNECLKGNEGVIDPKKYNKLGMDKVKNFVKEKIRVCGSEDKA